MGFPKSFVAGRFMEKHQESSFSCSAGADDWASRFEQHFLEGSPREANPAQCKEQNVTMENQSSNVSAPRERNSIAWLLVLGDITIRIPLVCIACQGVGSVRFTFRNRSALKTTQTELKLIAALARIGLRSKPKKGYSAPAATGTPSAL